MNYRYTIQEPIVVLIVEDNLGDVRLITEALKRTKIPSVPYVVSNGVDALAFLRQEEDYVDSPKPSLILLDLGIPKMNGMEVLFEIKNDERLHRIPVVVLTASKSEDDVRCAYEAHVNSYVIKPFDSNELLEAVRIIDTFWGNIVKLPPS